jgi:hypothetical protein
VSQSRDGLVRAIELAEGKRKEEPPAVLAAAPRDGSFLFVAADDVGAAARKAKAVVVQKMRGMRIDIGEAAGRIYAEAEVGTATERDAQDVRQMLEGGVAMGRMLAAGEAGLAGLVEASTALEFSASGTTVRARFSHESGKLLDMLKAVAAQRPDQKAGVKADDNRAGR